MRTGTLLYISNISRKTISLIISLILLLQPAQAADNISIPEQYGRVEKCQVSGVKYQVILIKDAHCHYEAQRNIAKILDILIRDYGIDLIGIEGASGDVDPSVITGSPDEKRRRATADKYLKKGWLTASESLAMERGRDYGFNIYGAEDLTLYLNNLKAFRDVHNGGESAQRFVESAERIISALKNKIYPPKALLFDDKIRDYRDNKMPLTGLIMYLYAAHKDEFIKYPDLRLVLKAVMLEKVIDFKNVEKERALLIKECEKKLPKEEIEEMVKKSLLFKLGKIPQAEYYSYLKEYIGLCGAWDNTKNLRRYIASIRLHSKIDEAALFKDLDLLTGFVYRRLITDEIAWRLHEIDEYIYLLGKLTGLEIARDELEDCKESGVNPSDTAEFLRIQAGLHGLVMPVELVDNNFIAQAEDFCKFPEQFYQYAFERDNVLVDNLLAEMHEKKRDKAALVVGGFHAEGAEKLLNEKGAGVITITPSITREDTEAKKIYLSRMMDTRINLDEITGITNLSAPVLTAFQKQFGPIIRQIQNEALRTALGKARSLEEAAKQAEAAAAAVGELSSSDKEIIRKFLAQIPEGQPGAETARRILGTLLGEAVKTGAEEVPATIGAPVAPRAPGIGRAPVDTPVSEQVIDLIGRGRVFEAVKRLNDALEENTITPDKLPSILMDIIGRIDIEKYYTVFAFMVSGFRALRDALRGVVIKGGRLNKIEELFNEIGNLIKGPYIVFTDRSFRVLDRIEESVVQRKADDELRRIEDELKAMDVPDAKRYLSMILLGFEPDRYSERRYKDFIYRVLSLQRVREIYPGTEYMELVVHISAKLEGAAVNRIETALKIMTRIKLRQIRRLLLLWRYKRLLNLGLGRDVIEGYFRDKAGKTPLVSQEQIRLSEYYPRKRLKTAGYRRAEDFKEELASLINRGLLRESLPQGKDLTPEDLRKAEIYVSHLFTSRHTLVSLVSVEIGGRTERFVLKKGFGMSGFSVSSDVFNFYQELAGLRAAETTLARQLGEWITPSGKDNGLVGYFRTEEYLAGVSVSYLNKKAKRKELPPEYNKLASSLAAAAYYILYKHIAGGRWFLLDATTANVMLVPAKDGGLSFKIVDIEARVNLPEGFGDENFITLLENRNFARKDVERGIRIAEQFVEERKLVFSKDVNPEKVRELAGIINESLPMTVKEAGLPEKTLAVGDVHGELARLKEILFTAGYIDGDGGWIAGDATLVQAGDIVDRGPHSIESLIYLLKLQGEARRKGGKVVLLLGNHELAYLNRKLITGMELARVLKAKKAGTASDKEVETAYRKYEGIRNIIADNVANGSIQAMYAEGNTVYVHAGIMRDVYHKMKDEAAGYAGIGAEEVTIGNISDYCNILLKKVVKTNDYSHQIFAREDGIFWARIGRYVAPDLPGDIVEVVGHTELRDIGMLGGAGRIIGINTRDISYLTVTGEGYTRFALTYDPRVSRTGVFLTENLLLRPLLPRLAMAHSEELPVGDNLVYDDGTKARGVLSVKGIPGMGDDETENAKRIKGFIQDRGVEAKTTSARLGVTVKVLDESELNKLLIENLDKLLDGLPAEFLAAIRNRVPRATPEGLSIALLDRSRHFGENHKGDGFIGINRYLLLRLHEAVTAGDPAAVQTLSNLLRFILYHELRHEAFPEKTEEDMYKEDMDLLDGITVDPFLLIQSGIIGRGGRLFSRNIIRAELAEAEKGMTGDARLKQAFRDAIGVLYEIDSGIWADSRGYTKAGEVKWHDYTHAGKNTLEAVKAMKKIAGIPPEAALLTAIAGMYHDVGYYKGDALFGTIKVDHEKRGMEFVKDNAGALGLTPGDVTMICLIIAGTQAAVQPGQWDEIEALVKKVISGTASEEDIGVLSRIITGIAEREDTGLNLRDKDELGLLLGVIYGARVIASLDIFDSRENAVELMPELRREFARDYEILQAYLMGRGVREEDIKGLVRAKDKAAFLREKGIEPDEVILKAAGELSKIALAESDTEQVAGTQGFYLFYADKRVKGLGVWEFIDSGARKTFEITRRVVRKVKEAGGKGRLSKPAVYEERLGQEARRDADISALSSMLGIGKGELVEIIVEDKDSLSGRLAVLLKTAGDITEDEVRVIVEQADKVERIFKESNVPDLPENAEMKEKIAMFLAAVELRRQAAEPRFVRNLKEELKKLGYADMVSGLVDDLYKYDIYDEYFALMLDGVRTLFGVEDGSPAGGYLKMLERYIFIKSKLGVKDEKFTGDTAGIYNVLLAYRNQNRIGADKETALQLLTEIAGIAADYIEDSEGFLSRFNNDKERQAVKEGLNGLISRRQLNLELKGYLPEEIPKERVKRAKAGYKTAGELLRKAAGEHVWGKGLPLVIEDVLTGVGAEDLLRARAQEGKLVIICKGGERRAEIIRWLSRQGIGRAEFIDTYEDAVKKFPNAVSMLTDNTAEQNKDKTGGHRVVRGTKSGEDDLMLMSHMADILGSVRVLSEDTLRNPFILLYQAYYEGTKSADEINKLVGDIVASIKDGSSIVIELPPMSPFIKAYYNTLKSAKELLAAAA